MYDKSARGLMVARRTNGTRDTGFDAKRVRERTLRGTDR